MWKLQKSSQSQSTAAQIQSYPIKNRSSTKMLLTDSAFPKDNQNFWNYEFVYIYTMYMYMTLLVYVCDITCICMYTYTYMHIYKTLFELSSCNFSVSFFHGDVFSSFVFNNCNLLKMSKVVIVLHLNCWILWWKISSCFFNLYNQNMGDLFTRSLIPF